MSVTFFTNLELSQLSNNHQQGPQEDRICQERIRQAKLAFNLFIAFAGASSVLALLCVAFLLTGRISQGAYAAVGGLASTAAGGRCAQLYREANDRLDRLPRS
ncbi:TRADD-N-associated membrane domain-containing protein [Leptolyngbya sp. FACHB-261]|uniref:TRADD-N-associated membrane domain-containing protein n=1 Tax=Leptolyngbya sp. FACHB-261 TaxID=2692806 RepID=UPI00168A1A10|nr:hypothetical protein [Leptolyngbya sp. FACHB-261]